MISGWILLGFPLSAIYTIQMAVVKNRYPKWSPNDLSHNQNLGLKWSQSQNHASRIFRRRISATISTQRYFAVVVKTVFLNFRNQMVMISEIRSISMRPVDQTTSTHQDSTPALVSLACLHQEKLARPRGYRFRVDSSGFPSKCYIYYPHGWLWVKNRYPKWSIFKL